MEYLEGRTLKRLIREEAPLETSRAIDLTIQMLKAARFAHRRGVIHRDLKPHNVIVDDNDHVKVTDFGIARAGASDMTETGSIMGTAQYLSPEQAQGHAVSAPSDLYSIGDRALRDADRTGSVRRRVAGLDRAQACLGGAGARRARSTPRFPRRSSRWCSGRSTRTRPTAPLTPTSSSWRSSRCVMRWPRRPGRSRPACARYRPAAGSVPAAGYPSEQ